MVRDEVLILGEGPFGIYLSLHLSEVCKKVFLYIPEKKVAEKLSLERNADVLGTLYKIPDNIIIISDLPELKGGRILIFACSSRNLEQVLNKTIVALDPKEEHLIVLFTKSLPEKSIRQKTGSMTFSQYISFLCSEKQMKDTGIVTVTGPNILGELKLKKHSFHFFSMNSLKWKPVLSLLFDRDFVHTGYSITPIPMELSGVMKNPIAIACGILSGLPENGTNMESLLISMGYTEIVRFLKLADVHDLDSEVFILSDLIATCTSRHGRNRQYGEDFIKKLNSGENKPNVVEKMMLFLNPGTFIENEVKKSESQVEGAYSLSVILQIASERNIQLPLMETIFDIIIRKKTPEALVKLLCGSEISVPNIQKTYAGEKQIGLTHASGQNFTTLLEKRIMHHIQGIPGMQERIARQSSHIVKNLLDRINSLDEDDNSALMKSMKEELKLWEELDVAVKNKTSIDLSKILDYYTSEISDNFNYAARSSLIHLMAPIRFVLSGFRSNSALPVISGNVKAIQSLSAKYNILYAPTHRSHLDSVEIAFGLSWSGLPVPRYAADRKVMSNPFWEKTLKSLGAYMVDRKRNRNIFYLECLTRYSEILLESGIPSLVYPEGTRSRTGGILPIKTGLLATAVEAYKATGREIIIVPLALSYESVPEDSEFCGEEVKPTFRDFFSKRSEVHLHFCDPIHVSRHLIEDDPTLFISLQIHKAWENGIRILPNQLLSHILCEAGYSVSLKDLKHLVADFTASHNLNYLTKDTEEIISTGIQLLKKKKFISLDQGTITGLKHNYLKYYGGMAAPLSQNI